MSAVVKPAWDVRMAAKSTGLGLVLAGLVAGSAGCNAIMNAWLDPTVVGAFDRNRTTEIRTSLTLEDTPPGIPGAEYPSPIDQLLIAEDYPFSAGDTLAIEIDELRSRDTVYQAQVQVLATGYVNLPVVGRVQAAEKTVPEFEEIVAEALRERGLLLDPQVTVNPLYQHRATYSIFGIGVSAANNAPLRAGTFPIRRPDLNVLEAINQVGGLNEFVTDVYVFRTYEPPPDLGASAWPDGPVGTEAPGPDFARSESVAGAPGRTPETPNAETEAAPPTAEQELMDAVAGDPEPTVSQRQPADEEYGEVPPELELDPSQPFLWDNVRGEFVPNPAYSAPRPETRPGPQEPPALDTATPAVNWARIAGETSYRVLRIPADLLRGGDPEVNIYVRPADVIRIVSGEIGVYYVMGQVNRVGPFAFNAESITLKAAIAAAGGLSDLGWPDRCTVYRRLGQREQMIQVNLDRIFAGKDPDFLIRRGDIINVGTHPFAPFLQRIREFTLPNPVSNVGYSFTYARNYADIDSFAVRRNPHNEPDLFPALFP